MSAHEVPQRTASSARVLAFIAWPMATCFAYFALGWQTQGLSRYLPVISLWATALYLRAKTQIGQGVRATLWVRVLPVLLGLAATVGSILGAQWFGTQSSALPFALPLLGFVLISSSTHVDLTKIRQPLMGCILLASIFAYISAFIRGGWFDKAAITVFNHEVGFVAVFAVVGAIYLRSRLLMTFALGGVIWLFTLYPAATTIVCLIASLTTLVAVAANLGRLGRRVAAGISIALGFVALAQYKAFEEVVAKYFEIVGKSDNSSTRYDLSLSAWDRIDGSPMFGDLFTKDLTLRTAVGFAEIRELPVHNDYLTLAMGGGWVTVALFLSWIMLLNGLVLRTLRTTSGKSAARILVPILCAFNSAMASAIANPVLFKPTASAIVAGMAACLYVTSISVLREQAGESSSPPTSVKQYAAL